MRQSIAHPKKHFFTSVCFALAFFVALILVSSARAGRVGASKHSGVRKRQLIVRYKNTINTLDKDAIETRRGDKRIRDFRNIPARVVKLGANRTMEQAIAEYKREANVEYAEPNYIVHTMDGPNDPRYSMLGG